MKIDNLLGIGASGAVNNTDSQQQSGKNGQVSFADQLAQVLQQALLEATSTDKPEDQQIEELLEEKLLRNKGMADAASNNKVALAKATDSPGSVLPPRDSVNALDDLLGMLEEYESLLANPATSLKELDPLVSKMQEKATALEANLEKMDSSINPLADQIISQAQIEVIKFRRGDFI